MTFTLHGKVCQLSWYVWTMDGEQDTIMRQISLQHC
jgi:hypothetical protein